MTANEILIELEKYGDKQTKSTLMKHGAREPFFGVKVADLKKILKKTKKNHELSLELYKTGNSDAMYLACLMADEKKISEAQLNDWIDKAYWFYLNEFAVPWVAAETSFGFELGLKWIQSDQERIAAAGWVVLSYYAGVNQDEDLDIKTYSQLLDRVAKEIHSSPNRVRMTMNGFVIAIATFIKELTDKSNAVASKIGKVAVDMNGTACKVPLATEYINNNIEKRQVGKKRKTARC
ncbi:MAG: DNA alkylation repair protein [Bacteroidales bacterium]|nr:DNA alkylation repair protein [Bacteroidales bacterium]